MPHANQIHACLSEEGCTYANRSLALAALQRRYVEDPASFDRGQYMGVLCKEGGCCAYRRCFAPPRSLLRSPCLPDPQATLAPSADLLPGPPPQYPRLAPAPSNLIHAHTQPAACPSPSPARAPRAARRLRRL